MNNMNNDIVYKPLNNLPIIEKDISFVKNGVLLNDIVNKLYKYKNLMEVKLIDVYEDSYCLRLYFNNDDNLFSNDVLNRIINDLETDNRIKVRK